MRRPVIISRNSRRKGWSKECWERRPGGRRSERVLGGMERRFGFGRWLRSLSERASLGGGRKRCYIINPAGVGETVGETVQSHRQPTQQACYRSCGTKRRLRMGMGRRMDMGRAWGLMALGARASVGQGTYHLVQVMCRLVHAGPTLGLPPEACDYWTTGPERPLRTNIDTAPRPKRCWPLGTVT